MGNNEDLGELLVEGGGLLSEGLQELEDGDLKEGVLNSSDFVLCVVLLGDKAVGPRDLGHKADQLFSVGAISIDMHHILEEGHTG